MGMGLSISGMEQIQQILQPLLGRRSELQIISLSYNEKTCYPSGVAHSLIDCAVVTNGSSCI